MTKQELKKYIDILYKEAKNAYDRNEVPISSVLIFKDGQYLVSSNHVEEENNPFSHAEFNVINDGLKLTNSKYLKDCILMVSLEPCLFCMGAILKSGIKEIYYVLDDEKLGSLSHYHTFVDDTLKISRIEDKRFKPLMDDFFKKIR